MVLGVRGIPGVQGGVETHAEQLYTRLAELGCDVEVIVRSPYVSAEHRNVGPIRLRRIWSPTRPGFEPLVHSLLGAVYAGFVRPDILHIHAVGPAAVTPLARLFGLKVVVTHHGPDYDRDRWGRFARTLLRFGEWAGMRFSNARIVISRVIADLVKRKHGRDSVLIPNGVVPIEPPREDDQVRRFGLEPGKYFLMVSRVVPEKRQLDLIAAYGQAKRADWKLAIVGGLGNDEYSGRVRDAAVQTGVVLTGFLGGTPLQQVYAHAGAFVLPSTHEGLPIAMLEALSYGLPVIASDIPANLEVGLAPESYFRVGDVESLAEAMSRTVHVGDGPAARAARRQWVEGKYNWDEIANQTRSVYVGVVENGTG
jgi:glycosyltransferase involved in cell wall biosynthesis